MRNRIRLTAVLLTALLIAPLFLSCNYMSDDTGPRTPQAEYTAEDPGEWRDIADKHLPVIEFVQKEGNEYLRVYVPLNDPSSSHYIEKIGILEKETKKDLFVKEFARNEDRYQIDIPYNYSDEEVKVFVKCNLHDLWTLDGLETQRELQNSRTR